MQVRAERLVAGGRAIARDADGRVVFVDGALPGELAQVAISRDRRDFAEGWAEHIVEPSPARRTPPCVHRRAGCGGCDWMHLDPAAQLAAKVAIAADAFTRTGRIPAEQVADVMLAGASVVATRYRTTVRVVGGADRRPGFRAARSHAVVPIDDCPVAVAPLAEAISNVRLDPEVELTMRVSELDGACTAWWRGPKGRRAATPDGLDRDVATGPRAALRERVDGAELRVSAASFFQASRVGAEVLVDAVRRAVPEAAGAGRGVDAYGGIGLFAATVLADVERVTIVETSASACADARHNAAGAEWTVHHTSMDRWQPSESADVLIADPARTGLGASGAAAVIAAAAPVVVLVSCDPVAGARDVRALIDAGYRLEGVEVLDL
ncbi:MAG: TRAM domain-containing protein, partial [Actinomycetota bacterium]